MTVAAHGAAGARLFGWWRRAFLARSNEMTSPMTFSSVGGAKVAGAASHFSIRERAQ